MAALTDKQRKAQQQARTRAAEAQQRKKQQQAKTRAETPKRTIPKPGPVTGKGKSLLSKGSKLPTKGKLHGGPVVLNDKNKKAVTTGATTNSKVAKPKPAPVQPFLTPDQQSKFIQAAYAYMGNVGDLHQQAGNAVTTEGQTLQNDKLQAQRNSRQTDDNMAARGLFQSSIRDGALNDIAFTQGTQDDAARTTLMNINNAINGKLLELGGDWAATVGEYDADAVTNAQKQTPVTNGPGKTGKAAPPPKAKTSATGIALGQKVATAIKTKTLQPSTYMPSWAHPGGSMSPKQSKNSTNNKNRALNAGGVLKAGNGIKVPGVKKQPNGRGVSGGQY